MKTLICLFCAAQLLCSPVYAVFQQREFNVWYEKDAVLYDMTQTSDGRPVMISISQPGHKNANLVISYLSPGACPAEPGRLAINSDNVFSQYVCVPHGNERIEHFLVTNADAVNDVINKLQSDFTVLLQGDIKVWAANIKSPKYGMAPAL